MDGRGVSFDEAELRAAVERSVSFSETLRRLGLRAAGGNHRTLRKYVERWGISTAHFDPDAWRQGSRTGRPLEEILVERSTYSNRGTLKQRLYDEELCARVAAEGYEAVGRSLGLPGNAIRKWKRQYERAAAAPGLGSDPGSTMPG